MGGYRDTYISKTSQSEKADERYRKEQQRPAPTAQLLNVLTAPPLHRLTTHHTNDDAPSLALQPRTRIDFYSVLWIPFCIKE